LSVLYQRTMDALNDAQVSVYPVDVRGLVNMSAAGDATYSGASDVPGFVAVDAGRSWLHSSTVASLKNFAEMTGGRAYYNNNDLAAGFKSAADDSSSYYLLGYYLDLKNTQPGWRKLQVQVADKDYKVRARTGFTVTNVNIDPKLTHDADVSFALSSPFDSTGIHNTVEWEGIDPALRGEKKPIGFKIHFPALGVVDEADENRFDVDVLAQATRKGAPATSTGQSIKGTIPATELARIEKDGISYKNVLELPPGDYRVRFVVRDNLRGRIGTVTAPLTIN
jgi:hypothetical protein